MRGAIPPLPHYALMASCSVKVKHRDNFTPILTPMGDGLTDFVWFVSLIVLVVLNECEATNHS
jgi:hypothetical protein